MRKLLFSGLILFLCSILQAQDETIDSLKRELSLAKNDTTKIQVLLQLVEGISDDNVWPIYNQQMLKLSEKLSQDNNKQIKLIGKKAFADALNNVGFIYNNQGDIPNALNYFEKSLKIKEEIGDKQGIAESFGNIGVIYYGQSDTAKALDYYLKALKIREQLGIKSDIANSLNNIGNLYYTMRQIPKALDYCERSLKLQEEIGDKQGLAYSLNNMGGIYYFKGEIPTALDYYTKSLEMRREIGDNHGVAASFHNIGTMYLRLYTDESSSTKKGVSLKLANTYTDSSLRLAKNIGLAEIIRNAERLLSKIDSAKGNYSSAFEHYKQFIIYRDSIANDANQKASMRNQLKYVFDKKEAVLLEQHDKERSLLKEKERVHQLIIWFVVIGLGLVLIFSIFLLRSLQQNKKANKTITEQKEIVEHKNHIIEEKAAELSVRHKEITDSINYAKRIQYSLLAPDSVLIENIPNHFIYFNPKDIVSGDFYWATKTENKFYLAVCDSTGHGVPGAFMSLLNIGFLSEAINEKGIEKPNEIFNYVRNRLITTISKDGQKDGFDGILICIDFESKAITYSAANNNPLSVRNKTITKLNSDRMPVGMGERKEDFNLYTIDYIKGDILYLYTDGYADQFGGPKGKKFMYKKLNDLINENSDDTLQNQQIKLKSEFENWSKDLEQVDDVLLIGIKL